MMCFDCALQDKYEYYVDSSSIITVMDIQIQSTPPKNKKNRDPYSTPPHASNKQSQESSSKRRNEKQLFETPPKKQFGLMETPQKRSNKGKDQINPREQPSGFKKRENPESKKQHPSPFNLKNSSPFCYKQFDQVAVNPFTLSRLEQDYSLVQYLGQGHFSQVGLYNSRLSGQLFAIKVAKANRMSVNQVQALGSIWILSGQCPNIVRYYHSWIEEGQLYLVMEHCQDTLQKTITRHRNSDMQIPEKIIINTLKAALQGLSFIHKNGILHLDIKPENILFKANTLKIADFGLSRATRMRSGEIEEGDSRYLAKQVLNIQSNTDLTKADIFSLGMAVYQMLTLQNLPNNGQQWMNIRQQGIKVADRMDLTNYSQQLLKLVEQMGSANWQERPSAAVILQHKLFKQSNRVNELFANRSNTKREQREISL